MTHENKDYVQILHEKGYRVTPQRLTVLDAVCDHQGHATLSDIRARVYELDPSIDRATIYRALDVLTEVGLIVETPIGDAGNVYLIAGESDHHHLVCLVCGEVYTVGHHLTDYLTAHFESEYGFQLQADHLVFNGVCKACAS